MLNKTLKNSAINQLSLLQADYEKAGDDIQKSAINLYIHRQKSVKIIREISQFINDLANTPKYFDEDMEQILVNIKEFDYALELENDAEQFNKIAGFSAMGASAVGAGVVAFGPSAAMAIATTFGTASTGAAISTLSGAAATNAALAWLGGGALAAGGGGMAAGNAFLALAGPIGWGIGAVSLGVGLFTIGHKNKKIAEEANSRALKVKESIEKLIYGNTVIQGYSQQTHEINNGAYILYRKASRLNITDYNQFNIDQRKELGILVNQLKVLSVLINKRIDIEDMSEIEYQHANA